MSVYLDDGDIVVHLGDCREVMAGLPAESIDVVISDPPYGLEFMGKDWDRPWAVGASEVGYTDGGKRLERPSHRGNRNPTCGTCGGRARGAKRCDCAEPAWKPTGGFRRQGNPADADRPDAFGRLTSRGPEYTPNGSADMRAFQEWCHTWAREAYRVLKPGGHLAAFGGTRTYHRLASGIEDAGFEIRDTLAWMYGSGFPKSLDVSKAIDKAAGHWRGKAGEVASSNGSMGGPNYERAEKGDPVTAAAAAAAGWGTALKPAYEPIVLARKPLRGTVAANFMEHGTGALNIDASRIKFASKGDQAAAAAAAAAAAQRSTRDQNAGRNAFGEFNNGPASLAPYLANMDKGRWPANVLLTHADECRITGPRLWACEPGCPVRMLDEQTGDRPGFSGGGTKGAGFRSEYVGGEEKGWVKSAPNYFSDTGGASRFFYTAKASSADRALTTGGKSDHPTVKPVDVMRWLVRLLTPPGGLILEACRDGGTTAVAARLEGFRCIGIEQHEPYAVIAADRLSQQTLLGGAA